MRGVKTSLIQMGLDALYFSGVYQLRAPATAGLGVIFMLHRVGVTEAGAFAPNRGLAVTPAFLDAVLTRVKDLGIDIVDLDEAARRLKSPAPKRFAVFTFDDGYADNIEAALPVFEAHDAPFTIYVTTGLLDGTADIWWLVVEEALKRLSHLDLAVGNQVFDLPLTTTAEKEAAWDAMYWPLRDLSPPARQALTDDLSARAGIDIATIFAAVAPSWEQLKRAAAHPSVRIGAHTLTHPPLSALPLDEARREIAEGRAILEERIGRPVRHFAYPFGDKGAAASREFALAAELGFATAVTCRAAARFSQAMRDTSLSAAARLLERRLPSAALCRCVSFGRAIRFAQRIEEARGSSRAYRFSRLCGEVPLRMGDFWMNTAFHNTRRSA